MALVWRLWKKIGYLLSVMSWHFPGGTENKHKERPSGISVSRSEFEFEFENFWIQSKCVIHLNVMFGLLLDIE
jgi:hypothetical protein